MVRLIQYHTGKRAAAIGDGGNDVSMIQAASSGIGIVGKEGMQVNYKLRNYFNLFYSPIN